MSATGRAAVTRCGRLTAVVALCALAGCAMKGFSIEKAVPDTTTITGSVPAAQQGEIDSGKLSDQVTIRNIVSALDFRKWGETPIPWANPETGSQGTITTVAEKKTETGLCRQFQTSREAFDGVSLYRGETCLQRDGAWMLKSFAPL
ncbi:RT0821/Lpp0805 family surface protein [Phyllobacterium phragmitis]|uniref:RT0821/Lpp0805 family surface protein n=1 Tax=Phyllobacterium phragmitis TaxID=2670329 RepID=UPI0038B25945